MSSKQDGPARKKQKVRARRKLARWRAKRAPQEGAEAQAAQK